MSNHSLSNDALAPVAAVERVFTGVSHASLWFSLGVGLLVMQVGAYLVPAMGTQDAMLAIVLGGLVGLRLLPLSALPQVDYPTIQVQTLYPGAGPEVMAQTVRCLVSTTTPADQLPPRRARSAVDCATLATTYHSVRVM